MSAHLPLLPLSTRPADSLRGILPPNRDPAAWHAALAAEIASALTPAHAFMFAAPHAADGQIAWQTNGARMKSFAELGAADRQALIAAITVILSDIRRLAERGAAPMVTAAWPALREIPDLDCVYAVDGRPVLAGWGHIGARAERPPGLLTRFDDQIPWARPVAWPPRPILLTCGALAALALLCGLFLPFAGAWLFPVSAQCVLDPAGAGLLQEAGDVANRRAQLEEELARLEEERGRARLACPLPQAPPPVQVAIAPSKPAPPPPKPGPPPALPQEKWDRGDLSMLKGCWHNTTPMNTIEAGTHIRRQVADWKMCFDISGQGSQTVSWPDGYHCDGPLHARFEGGKMIIAEPARCTGDPRHLFISRHECTRVNDNEANCQRTEMEGPTPGQTAQGTFKR